MIAKKLRAVVFVIDLFKNKTSTRKWYHVHTGIKFYRNKYFFTNGEADSFKVSGYYCTSFNETRVFSSLTKAVSTKE